MWGLNEIIHAECRAPRTMLGTDTQNISCHCHHQYHFLSPPPPLYPLSLFAKGLTYTDIKKYNLLDHNSQLLEYYVWIGSETVHFLSPPHPTLSFRFMRRGSITITHLFSGTAETWNCRWNISERVRCSLSWRLSKGLKRGEFQVELCEVLTRHVPTLNLDPVKMLFHICFVQWLSHVWLFATLWTAACQASLSFTISWV